jgi:hypothetical protein
LDKKIEYETKKTTLKNLVHESIQRQILVFDGRIELLYKQKFSKFSLDDPAGPRQE